MLDQKTLHAALKKVSAAMMHLENTGFEEKYPIGLIDINLWEWPQGVGRYGLYNYYKLTGDRGAFDFLCGWYDARMAEGLPERNVNTTCPCSRCCACTRTHRTNATARCAGIGPSG